MLKDNNKMVNEITELVNEVNYIIYIPYKEMLINEVEKVLNDNND